MTEYVGETIEIFSSGLDFDAETPLGPDNTTSVVLHLEDSAGVLLIDGDPLTWSAEQELWVFRWETVGQSAGNFRGRVTFVSAGGTVSFEFLTIRLKAPKFDVDFIVDGSDQGGGGLDGGHP